MSFSDSFKPNVNLDVLRTKYQDPYYKSVYSFFTPYENGIDHGAGLVKIIGMPLIALPLSLILDLYGFLLSTAINLLGAAWQLLSIPFSSEPTENIINAAECLLSIPVNVASMALDMVLISLTSALTPIAFITKTLASMICGYGEPSNISGLEFN